VDETSRRHALFRGEEAMTNGNRQCSTSCAPGTAAVRGRAGAPGIFVRSPLRPAPPRVPAEARSWTLRPSCRPDSDPIRSPPSSSKRICRPQRCCCVTAGIQAAALALLNCRARKLGELPRRCSWPPLLTLVLARGCSPTLAAKSAPPNLHEGRSSPTGVSSPDRSAPRDCPEYTYVRLSGLNRTPTRRMSQRN
jgi:hypothetical protein